MAEALSTIDRKRLARLEEAIQKNLAGFVEAGRALMEIRDQELYRGEYAAFGEYCRGRWGFEDGYARRLIRGCEVITVLQNVPIGTELLPGTESQVRPLTAIQPEEVGVLWQQVIARAPKDEQGQPRITAAHVEETIGWWRGQQGRDEHKEAAHPSSLVPSPSPLPQVTCPNCGGHEADDEGDCASCREPGIGKRAVGRGQRAEGSRQRAVGSEPEDDSRRRESAVLRAEEQDVAAPDGPIGEADGSPEPAREEHEAFTFAVDCREVVLRLWHQKYPGTASYAVAAVLENLAEEVRSQQKG